MATWQSNPNNQADRRKLLLVGDLVRSLLDGTIGELCSGALIAVAVGHEGRLPILMGEAPNHALSLSCGSPAPDKPPISRDLA